MPNIRKYNESNIVYFEEDQGTDMYVLQKGGVTLITAPVGDRSEKRIKLKVGEFFGVKSSLGGFPREETAQVTMETSLVVFTPKEFENYIVRNTRLIVKMLQIFSKELREIHGQLRSLLKVEKENIPSFSLLNVAEVYYKNHHQNHAKHAFECYLKYYPNGKNVERVKNMLGLIAKKEKYPTSYPSPEPEEDILVFPSDRSTELAEEENLNLPIHTLFKKASVARANKKNKEAIELFKKCIEHHKEARTEGENKKIEGAYFQLGKVYLETNDLDNASNFFYQYIKSFHGGLYVKNSLFHLAEIKEKQNNKKHAIAFYMKVATMHPMDQVTISSRKKLQSLGKV